MKMNTTNNIRKANNIRFFSIFWQHVFQAPADGYNTEKNCFERLFKNEFLGP